MGINWVDVLEAVEDMEGVQVETPCTPILLTARPLLPDFPVTVAKVENSKTKSKRGRHNERYGFNKPLAK
tara:strand:- start:32302 stop:32511 length:210 start_codon:yes stop_codon:yes gene_type:complete